MQAFHGYGYMSLVPIHPDVPVTKVTVDYESEGNPDGVPEVRRQHFGVPQVLCNQMPADVQSTYIVAGINGLVNNRGIQVVVEDIDATGTVVIEYSINGRDWTALPTPIMQAITSAAGRQTYMWSFSNLVCLQFRVGWSPGGGATTGTIEVYVI